MFVNNQDQPLRIQLIDFGQAVPAAKIQTWMAHLPPEYRYLHAP